MIEAYFDLLDGMVGHLFSQKTKDALYSMTVTLFDAEVGQVFETLCTEKEQGFMFHKNIAAKLEAESVLMIARISKK
jgi:hypothetical protein